MLSTIRTIFTFNKNLTLDLPSALTWVFLYNHEGPCGVVLCSLEVMIIKKHLLSDFSSIWFSSLSLWCLLPPGCATGLPMYFSASWLNSSFFSWITAHSSQLLSTEVCLWEREAPQPTVQCVILLMCLLAVCKLVSVFHLSFPML